MRYLIVCISILCLALSGLITFKALNLPEKKYLSSASSLAMLKPTGKQDPGSKLNQADPREHG